MPAHDVFLSHSSHDKVFVKELHRRLTRDGVHCFFDTESIDWGDNIPLAIERGLKESRFVILILSPAFCNSQWVQTERTSSMFRDPTNVGRKLLPLMLHPCRDLPNFPIFLEPLLHIDVSTTSAFEQNYPRICSELGGTPSPDAPATEDRTQLPPVQNLPHRHLVPFASLGDKFIGRVQAIWELRDSLFQNRTTILQGVAVVVGTGGLGKTQLALEYAHRFGPAYTGGVYWINAELGLVDMVTKVSEAAGVTIDTKAEKTVQVAQLWREINARNLPCLVILDNLPESATLRTFLPTTGNLHTIVTTRRQDLNQPTVRLPMLSLEESIRMLDSGERNFPNPTESLKPLAARLGGHPLALELSRSYLNARKDLTPSAVLEEMRSQGEMNVLQEFLSECRDQLPSGHEPDVVATFQLSWRLATDLAQDILRIMGELAPAPVPGYFLRLVLNPPRQSPMQDPLNKAIAELERLSLVELSSNRDPAAHRLILAFARHRNTADAASPLDRCSAALIEQMERAYENPGVDTIRELESLLPHAEFLLENNRLNPEDSAKLLNSVGTHHQTMGRFTAARLALEKALASSESHLESGHPNIATRQSNLALVLKDLGQFGEARDLLRKALAADENSFEPGHPTIAIRQSNLALVLKDMGQFEEARDLLREVLASDENSFEPGHPSIARSQSNLAVVLQALGQLEEARDLLRKALASDENSFEPGHPSIAIGQSNLAMVLKDLGQLEEARDLLRKALAADESSFETGHPAIARSQLNLALVLKDLGHFEEARDLLRKALTSNENSFEPGHPTIAISQSNLASVLRNLGQLEEARDLLRKALASDENSFEPGHPTIAIRQSNLALVLKDLGHFEEARELLKKAYTTFLERLGPDHPNTKTVQNILQSLPQP